MGFNHILTLVETDEIIKGHCFVLADTVEYAPGSVISKTCLKKATGIVYVFSADTGKVLAERTSPFDTFIQVIEGTAEVIIENKPITVYVGQALVIPAHVRSSMVAKTRFKMISITIKSGYEELA